MQTAASAQFHNINIPPQNVTLSKSRAKYRVAQTIFMPPLETAGIIYQNNNNNLNRQLLNSSLINNTLSSIETNLSTASNNSQYLSNDDSNRNFSQTLSRNSSVGLKRHQSLQNYTNTLPRNFNPAHITSTPMPGLNSLYNPLHHIQHNTISQGQHSHQYHHQHQLIKQQYDDTINKLISFYGQQNSKTNKTDPNGSLSKNFQINYNISPSISYKPLNKLRSSIPNYDPNIYNGEPNDLCVRFAVNGLSKYTKSSVNSTPQINRNLQAGDFGDDAGMIAENSKCIVIGLADGAGGNRSIGIDPQKFSRALMGYCVEIVRNDDIMSNQMTKLACKSVQSLETKNIEGSGTLCLLGLNKYNNMMFSLNIGDSGFRLLRNGSIVHKSKATMAGSSPKQLYVSDSSSYSGISFITEEEIALDSDLREFPVKKGDIILLSSDGLFDVLQDSVIENLVNNRNEKDLQGMADDLLVQTMRSYSLSQRDDILIMICRIESKDQFKLQKDLH